MGGWAEGCRSILGAERDMSLLSLAQIWILAALDQQAEGDGREGEPFAQQCVLAKQGHFYPVVSPSGPATANDSGIMWAPGLSLISGCHPSTLYGN